MWAKMLEYTNTFGATSHRPTWRFTGWFVAGLLTGVLSTGALCIFALLHFDDRVHLRAVVVSRDPQSLLLAAEELARSCTTEFKPSEVTVSNVKSKIAPGGDETDGIPADPQMVRMGFVLSGGGFRSNVYIELEKIHSGEGGTVYWASVSRGK